MRNTARCATGHDRPESAVTIAGIRTWDVRRRKMVPPDPRPLYNQPGILKTDQVVLVEGEKCAQALIDLGVCATTAMHGANAPVDNDPFDDSTNDQGSAANNTRDQPGADPTQDPTP